jgi:hypothetical protein
MGYAILRMSKIKHVSKLRHSLNHAFREQNTPNADPSRALDNTHIGGGSVREVLDKFNAALPDKVRKNAVLAIEYLITASPENLSAMSRNAQDKYFADSLLWLRDKHGAENIIYAGIHRDEKTPHVYAYVIPKVNGKLNARHFFGERDALSKMQTDFAEKVGLKHGLERGIEGSQAKHTRISEYYARINQETPLLKKIDVPEPTVTDRLKPLEYGYKVANAVRNQINPAFTVIRDKAIELELVKKNEKALQSTAKVLQSQNQAKDEKLEALKTENGKLWEILKTVPIDRLQAFQERERAKEAQAQQEREAAQKKQAAKEHMAAFKKSVQAKLDQQAEQDGGDFQPIAPKRPGRSPGGLGR